MPLKTLSGLIVCNLIWSANPIMAKLLLSKFTPCEVAWIRYGGAFSSYFICYIIYKVVFSPQLRPKHNLIKLNFFIWPRRKMDRFLVFFLGFFPFCFAPLTQMWGLTMSLASENSIIAASEPLITTFLAWIFLKEKINWVNGVALLFASLGFVLLVSCPAEALTSGELWSVGNVLLLASLFGESFFTVIGRKLTSSYDALGVFGTSLAVGTVVLTGIVCLRIDGAHLFTLIHWNWRMAFAAFWIGPFGTTMGYLFWIYALVEADAMSVTLPLFLQPVVGVLCGYLFLGDRLSNFQYLGGTTILIAVLIPPLLSRVLERSKVGKSK